MKKVKKNLFGMGLALSMMLGMVFALVPQEVKGNAIDNEEGGFFRCYLTVPQGHCEPAFGGLGDICNLNSNVGPVCTGTAYPNPFL